MYMHLMVVRTLVEVQAPTAPRRQEKDQHRPNEGQERDSLHAPPPHGGLKLARLAAELCVVVIIMCLCVRVCIGVTQEEHPRPPIHHHPHTASCTTLPIYAHHITINIRRITYLHGLLAQPVRLVDQELDLLPAGQHLVCWFCMKMEKREALVRCVFLFAV